MLYFGLYVQLRRGSVAGYTTDESWAYGPKEGVEAFESITFFIRFIYAINFEHLLSSHRHLIFHPSTIFRKGFTHIFLESHSLGRGFIRCYILRTGSCLLRHHAGRQKQQHEQHQWEQSESTDYRPPHSSYGRRATHWIDLKNVS